MAYTFKHGDRPIEGITIQRAVGRGGFGEVYYALSDSGKQLAVKYLRENPDVELRGIAQVMNLKSPHLITIYDVRRGAEGEPFVVMEYVSGPSLREIMLASPGGLGPDKAAFFLVGIAKGLSYLHERGIVHRDLKPGNIFYDDGYVKIGDYGLSKHISVSQHSGQTVSVGTVHYMAPEIGSGSYSKAIDIYSLGVMLYEMITGRLPYAGSSMAEVLMRHLSDSPNLAGIPEPYARVISRALAKNPAERYQDVNEMIDPIIAVSEISNSIAAFDVTSISHVPRTVAATDGERTVTTPPRGAAAPALDVRNALPPLPRIDAMPAAEPKSSRRRKGFFGGIGRVVRGIRANAAQALTLLVVVVAVSAGLSLLGVRGRQPEAAIAIAFYLIGGTVGSLVAYFGLLRRSLTDNNLMDRLVFAGAGFLFMAPGLGPAGDLGDAFQRLIIAPIAVLLFCDWKSRIEEGRRQRIRGGAAWWPAIIGLVASAIADAEQYLWIGAGIGATLSLLTQAAAAMWPVAASVYSPVSAPILTGGLGVLPPPIAPAGPSPAPAAPIPPAVPATIEKPVAAAPAPMQQREVFEPAGPSFIGRAANVGLATIGKMFLVVGLLWSLAFASERYVDFQNGQTRVTVGPSGVHAVTPGGEVRQQVPRIAVLVPFVLGTILVIASRRHNGAGHIARGAIGSAFALGAAIMAIGPAYQPLRTVLSTNDWNTVRGEDAGVILATIALVFVSIVMLFWPHTSKQRAIFV